MRGNEVDDWAMYSQITMQHTAPHQKAWMVERHNALIRSALQRADAQVTKESLHISFNTVLGLVIFMHNALVCINNNILYQVLQGRWPHRLPPLEGGYHGDLNVNGQHNLASVREIAAGAIIHIIAQQRLVRGDTRNQVPFVERSEHVPRNLTAMWYDPLSGDTPGWRAPAQIAIVNEGEGNVTVMFQDVILDP